MRFENGYANFSDCLIFLYLLGFLEIIIVLG